MHVNRRASKEVVGRLARGVGRVVKAGWAAPAGRGATDVKRTEGFYVLVPAESAPCLFGVNATLCSEPRWLDACVGTRAYPDICDVGRGNNFLWCACSFVILVLLPVWFLPSCPSLVCGGHLVCSFTCSRWVRRARRDSRSGRGRVVLASGRKGVSDPYGRRPAPPGPSPLGVVTAHKKRILLYNVLYQ